MFRYVNPISTKGGRLYPPIGFASSKNFRDYALLSFIELFIPFFDFLFSLVLADEVTKIPEYYVICLFTSFKSLACLALQMETIIKKITQIKLQKTKNEVTKICNEPGIRVENCIKSSFISILSWSCEFYSIVDVL